jgi:LPS export ABC transporter protein LptC
MIRRVTIRNSLLILMLATVVVLLFVISGRFQPPSVEKIVEALPEDVDLALKKVDYTETRGDEKLWTLSADSVDHVSGQQETLVENVRMVFFSKGEFGDITLTACKGHWFMQEGRIDLQGDVVAKSSNGFSLYTQRLTYMKEDDLIFTDLPVRLVNREMELTGTGLRLPVKDQSLELLSNVQGKFHAP